MNDNTFWDLDAGSIAAIQTKNAILRNVSGWLPAGGVGGDGIGHPFAHASLETSRREFHANTPGPSLPFYAPAMIQWNAALDWNLPPIPSDHMGIGDSDASQSIPEYLTGADLTFSNNAHHQPHVNSINSALGYLQDPQNIWSTGEVVASSSVPAICPSNLEQVIQPQEDFSAWNERGADQPQDQSVSPATLSLESRTISSMSDTVDDQSAVVLASKPVTSLSIEALKAREASKERPERGKASRYQSNQSEEETRSVYLHDAADTIAKRIRWIYDAL